MCSVQQLESKVSLLLCREGKGPGPQEQAPEIDESFVPAPAIEQLPGIHVEIQRPTEFPSESQIPVTVAAPEDEHPPPAPRSSTPLPPPITPPPPPPRTRRVSVSSKKNKNSVL